MATPLRDTAWTEWMATLMGAASRQRYTATLPMQKFHCVLDELPLHLVPAGVFSRKSGWESSAQPLVLNSECSILSAGQVPEEFATQMDLLEGFCRDGSVAWVRDPAANFPQPFWLGPRLESVISGLRAGDRTVSSLSDWEKFALNGSGILAGAGQSEKGLSEFSNRVNVANQFFRENNYAPLGGLIHPFHLAALRRYYRHAIRNGDIRLGDEQSSRRYVAHNEPVARFFHHRIASLVSAAVGEPVKPSYVYFASYLSGAELKKHTDREQCEFSITFCLDFSPEPEQATSWPICLETPSGKVSAYQAPGDGLIYRGTRIPHYRSPLREGYTSTSIFFHYVPEKFSGSLN